MTEEELLRNHGPRLEAVLGKNFKQHPGYAQIVRDVVHGSRTISNALADFEVRGNPSLKRGW
ncbi:hypothetical protein A3A39_00585 [Candidatus Kaiserbacteria bacterium RIFCSPLOWO2_01_FULL_54_13]|uniref:Uncharacterized protein n=1 Tax=Candidatus Kaiserbacteria bacterium RIFCSPLOWO2_01_FULL_54_13 TaxID=1798512 RepID=A0A1F6F0K7_9BACT|nr:MAG: hypothetical protein A3A39_00585 [Candidatus Kaiserbacteria bacterium RIFCSPLOWO2_01_FULL_54_13]